MISTSKPYILVAEDYAEDRMQVMEALKESFAGAGGTRFVEFGDILLDYLLHRGKFAEEEKFLLPGQILLYLNMPQKENWVQLKAIESFLNLRCIPVIVLATSNTE